MITDDGPIRIEVPRDRDGSFEPQLIGKHERRFTGFDQKIIAMYARGMTVREIQGYLAEMYGTEVSPEFISKVTDEVMAEVVAWQSRPLEPMYPVVFFDALRVKIRDDAVVRNKAVYLALGVLPDGSRDVLGLWIEQTEGAKFWLKVFNELKQPRRRRHPDRRGRWARRAWPRRSRRRFPATTVQTCIVHLIRNSLDFASWKDRKAVAAALRPIYTAATAAGAPGGAGGLCRRPLGQQVSDDRAVAGDAPGSTSFRSLRFPPEVRRVIYTTNAIESLHMQLRKIIKTRGHFPSDEAATKLLWLALRNITAGKVRSTREWKAAMNQFAILYGDRFTIRRTEITRLEHRISDTSPALSGSLSVVRMKRRLGLIPSSATLIHEHALVIDQIAVSTALGGSPLYHRGRRS